MEKSRKLVIAGVGGQGVVYLTELIVEAGLIADIPVATSEIHGLARRMGSVVAGITFGEHAYGFVEEAGADFLIGLEPLEARRCLPLLNKSSKAVIDNHRIYPHSVNAGKVPYPDVDSFVDFLRANIECVVFLTDFNIAFTPILRNLYVLGKAVMLDGFPLPGESIEEAINDSAKKEFREESVKAFRLGRAEVKVR